MGRWQWTLQAQGVMRIATMAYRSKSFDYSLDYKQLNLRARRDLYRVGRGEQGVLLVEPYKSEILPFWRFKTPAIARKSAAAITRLFKRYKTKRDFVGMDMARKFLQMGFTRARRYANHPGGKKYASNGKILPFRLDETKAKAAEVFYAAWKKVEGDPYYAKRKAKEIRREKSTVIK